MKKHLLLSILIIVISCVGSFAQTQIPDVISEILVQDLAGGQKVLQFGLDSIATDVIDPQLGESDLPPFPPAGTFEARLFLPEDTFSGLLSSYSDFRQALLPYTGQKEFRLAYQRGTGTVIKITWDFPQNITGLLQDIIIGTVVNVPMTDSGSYTVTIPDAINRLKMTINYVAIIPVELVSFGATINNNKVSLIWKTASELNNSGFEIQRKSENSGWQKISFIKGAGTTTESKVYKFVDSNIPSGKLYYRLRQVDFNGTFSYSKVVEVQPINPANFNLSQNYPNPFNPVTSISFSIPSASNVKLTIYNQIGEKVAELLNENLEAGVYSYNWNASRQSSGIYFYELQADEYRSIRKMTLLK